MARAGFLEYLKEAFLYRWNLLLFGGAAAAAVISGAGAIALPLVAAGEVAYLASMAGNSKFQKAVDVKRLKEAKGSDKLLTDGEGKPVSKQARLGAMLGGLSHGSRVRFQRLRSRCIEMQRIAKGVTGHSSSSSTAADDLRTPALDKLLWVFLRLLYSQQALQKFLAATDADAIEQRIAALEKRKESAAKKGDERILRSVTDSVSTETMRLDNYKKAEANADFVAVELDRIEAKISAIIEMGVSNQDAEYISSQVDAVADSMAITEEAISDLQSITGLTSELEEPPSILDSDVAEVAEA